MITDVSLIFGCMLCIFSITGALAAFAERRLSIQAIVMFVLGGAMILYAALSTPGELTFSDVPKAIVRIIGHIIK